MYVRIEEMIAELRGEAEANQLSMQQVGQEAHDKITELESIKQDAEEVGGELTDYITNLDGLVATIEKAEGIVDEAQGQGIEI